MAKMNMFAERGIQPTQDVYVISVELMAQLFTGVIKDRFDIDVTFVFDTGDNEVNVYLNDINSIDEDILEQMIFEGFDHYDPIALANTLLHIVVGEQDARMKMGSSANGLIMFVYVPSRQDIKEKAMALLEASLNGTREETIIEINRLLRYLRGETK